MANVCLVAASSPYRAEAISWLLQDQSGSLNSSMLLKLVPPTAAKSASTYPWMYYRFEWAHAFRLWRSRAKFSVSEEDPLRDSGYPKSIESLTVDVASIAAGIDLDFAEYTQDVIFKLAEFHFYGILFSRDLETAFALYKMAADLGHAGAQFMTGLAYATGVFGNFAIDQAKATLYYTFGALGGDMRASMAIGNRHFLGIGTKKDMLLAAQYYQPVADAAMGLYNETHQLIGYGDILIPDWVAAYEMGTGIYGNAAVPSSSWLMSPPRRLFPYDNSLEEGIENTKYYANDDQTSEVETLNALFNLMQANFFGDHFGERDVDSATEYAMRCYDFSDDGGKLRFLRVLSMKFLCDRYLNGDLEPADWEKAARCYDDLSAFDNGQPRSNEANVGRAIMALSKFRETKKLKHLKQAEELLETTSWSEDSYYYHAYVLELLGDLQSAKKVLEKGTVLFGSCRLCYALANLYLETSSGSDEELAGLYRRAARYSASIFSPLEWAQRIYEVDANSALLGYLIAAEQGYVSSQINIADMLDERHSTLPISWLQKWPVPDFVRDRAATALMYFTRAASDYDTSALAKVAEYYRCGVGVAANPRRAVDIYLQMSRRHSWYASYWLGYMYQHGIGVPKDYHLAKRYYDVALHENQSSYVLLKLALTIIQIQKFWHYHSWGKWTWLISGHSIIFLSTIGFVLVLGFLARR